MVQFGRRFETSQTRRWTRHNADYERLKLLIQIAATARDRDDGGRVGLDNFGRRSDLSDAGLLDAAGALREGTLGAGLAPTEKAALETLWRKNRRRGAGVAKSTSLGNLKDFAFGAAASSPSRGGAGADDDDDDDSWHWSRWLFSSRLPRSYALLAHGFDVAVVAELAKVESLYDRELQVLQSRWQDVLAEDEFEEDDTEDEAAKLPRKLRSDASRGDYASITSDVETPPRPPAQDRIQASPRRVPRHREIDAATRQSLKRSLAQLDADARELIDFTVWNFTAFTKITKKRDKKLKDEPNIRERFTTLIRRRDGCAATAARQLLRDVHARYAELFCGGNTTEAELELREAARAENEGAQTLYGGQGAIATLRFGYRAGVAATLAVWVMWDCVEVVNSVHKHMDKDSVAAKAAWPLFRVSGVLLAWHWLWGLSLWVWHRFRVNQAFLFDVVDTAQFPAPSAADVFDECILETNVLLSLLLLYYKSTYRGGMPKFVESHPEIAASLPETVPLILVTFLLKCLFLPWGRRRRLWAILGRVVRAPFCEVRFVDTYVADVLTSMIKVILDAIWVTYFLLSGTFRFADKDKAALHKFTSKTHSFWYKEILVPAMSFLPVWFRFAQCLRKYADVGDSPGRFIHLRNAAKYAFSLFVTMFSVVQGSDKVRARWLALFVVSSVYSWLWDVTVDWGLHLVRRERGDPAAQFRRSSTTSFEDKDQPFPKKRWLVVSRTTRMYPRAWWYRAAAFADLGGRFVWLAQLMPPSAFGSHVHSYIPDYLTPILALAELARRCVWGFFRLENEHISNAFQHRREGQFVPSHLRSARPRKNPKRILSVVETAAIACVVVGLVSRMTLLAEDADAAKHGLRRGAVPHNATLRPWPAAPGARSDDDASSPEHSDDAVVVSGSDDDTVVHTHHHHRADDSDDSDDSDDPAVADDAADDAT